MRRLLALGLLLLAPPARGAVGLLASVEELARASDLVVRGTVEGLESRPGVDGRQLYTFATVRTAAAWRGSAPALVVVRVPGGAAGGVAVRVPGAPAFAPGEEVVLFLRRSGEVHTVAGLAQGKLRVVGAEARPDLAGLHLQERALAAGERRSEAMPLAELERRVRGVR